MERTIHFIAGLPRSGSTLLCNLLAQNPRFHTTSTSGIVGVVRMVNEQWTAIFGADDPANEGSRRRALRAILQSYHDDPSNQCPVVFDKSRGWLGNLNLAEIAFGRKAKALVCVRDVRDILASFEKLWRKNASTWAQPQEERYFIEYQTVEGRCDVMMRPDQVVGGAYQRIKTALARGMQDRMFFVEYEKITTNPKEMMEKVYAFLGEPYFEHDFDSVEQVTVEDDFMHGIPGLHVIRQKIEPMEPQWPKILGPVAGRYTAYNNLWLRLNQETPKPDAFPAGTTVPTRTKRRKSREAASASAN